ncbi:hypothetical protein OG535_19410 [Kitasatospora sp. NBC_00085]|uniref:hypothetical protein n=1 Tax=unclassified Kitasatospora TaxID=2633591 RepID=UPI00324AEB49
MTTDRKTALALLASTGLLLSTAACSSSGSDAPADGAKLSYAKLKSTAQGLGSSPFCPFGLDLAAALKASGIERTVTPAGGDKPVRVDVVPAEAAQPLPPGVTPTPSVASIPARPESVQVWCSYTAGTTPVEIAVVAAPGEKVAVNLALPYIQAAGQLTSGQLVKVSTEQPAPGGSGTTPGEALVGIARLPVTNHGDLALMVSQGTSAPAVDKALTGEALQRLTEKLAAQLHA